MLAVVIEKAPQTGLVWWVPLLLLIAVLAAIVTTLTLTGPRDRGGVRRPAAAMARLTGLPAWCACGIGIALWSLSVALVGFIWDVAWHADLGRDKELFTPPHTMILTGLTGIGVAALSAIVLATLERADVRLRVGPLRVPWSSLPMGLMALGALVGFPLDDYWHSVYGIDVTMWSPTHLLMIGGASLTPIAAWLMLAESEVPARARSVRMISEALAGATLLGLSTFQLEFDLGIPQWQLLYHPALIAIALGVGLVAAREALGPGGAVRATVGFLAIRGLMALLVGPLFGLSVPRFPLYLGGALAVEGAYVLGARATPLARALLSGVLIATVGEASEWGWTHAWGLQPWQTRLLPSWWVVIAMALTCSVLGSLLGRAVTHRREVTDVRGAALAFAAMVALLVVPFPRHAAAATATVHAAPVGPAVPMITRDGTVGMEQDILVDVTVSPDSAADSADVFRAVAWQGGQIIVRPLHDAGGGHYTTDATLPTGGTWKSLVYLNKGDVVAAVPIDFPADAQYGLAAIHAPSTPRTQAFQPASAYLTRESHGGSALPAILAYTALGLVAVTWGVALVGVGEAMARRLRTRIGSRVAGGTA